MESPASWDTLTAMLACTDLEDPRAALDALVWAGLVVPMSPTQRARLEAAVGDERSREITGPSVAWRVAAHVRAEGVVTLAAAVHDPFAHASAREARAFAADARQRVCSCCGRLSVEWWQTGACPCGARRRLPCGQDTAQHCTTCERPALASDAFCEACGRAFERPLAAAPVHALCEAIAEESRSWGAPATAAEVRSRTARLCSGLELLDASSFLEVNTLLPALEALLETLHGSTPELVSAGLGAAMRARLLRAVEAPGEAARGIAGNFFDHHDAFKRLARMHELVLALPDPLAATPSVAPSPPPRPRPSRPAARDLAVQDWLSRPAPDEVRRLREHLATRFQEIARSWTAMKESYGGDVHNYWDDYALAKGNARFATIAHYMLRELDLAQLPTPSSLLDAAANVCATAPEDPDYDPPRTAQMQLVTLVDDVYANGLG